MKLLPLLLIALLSACITVNVNYGTPRTAGETNTTRGNADANGNDSESDCDQQLRMTTRLESLAGSPSPTRILSQNTRYSAPTAFRMKRSGDPDDICLDDDSEVLQKQNTHRTRTGPAGLPGVELAAEKQGTNQGPEFGRRPLRLRQF
jgi:hypothetical protein